MSLHEDAAAGRLDEVRLRLRDGVAVDALDEQGHTALARAARSSLADETMLRLLIEAGADVNRFVDNGAHFPLELAAASGSLSKVQCLLDAGAEIRQVAAKGYSVLIHAIYGLHDDESLVPMIELLLARGAEIAQETEYGESPLNVAVRFGRFDAVRTLVDAGADTDTLGWPPLVHVVVLGSVSDVADWFQRHESFDRSEPWNQFALSMAAHMGDLSKVQLLAAHGFAVDAADPNRETPLLYSATGGHADVLRWLIDQGANVETVDRMGETALVLAAQSGHTECVRLLLEAGANPHHLSELQSSAISVARNEPILRLLLEAGLDLNDASPEMKRQLVGLPVNGPIEATLEEYRAGRGRRFGRSNPEAMDIPFWNAMVRAGGDAYQPQKKFGDRSGYDAGPVWCFERFGMSITELPDGRIVQIAGEHEDYYDPDFCIYNDVVVHDRSGTFQIYDYPEEAFPPTDFHTATLVGNAIYIIGRLGYHGTRAFGTTPVYRLDCGTWEIQEIETAGENPGWIYKHKARLGADGRLVVIGGKVCEGGDEPERHVANDAAFSLDLASRRWNRL